MAGFVGQLNLLPINSVDLDKKTCTIGGQTVRFSHHIARPDGSDLRLAIRPEEIQFGEDSARNQLRGKVETVMFLGAVIRLRVVVGETRPDSRYI